VEIYLLITIILGLVLALIGTIQLYRDKTKDLDLVFSHPQWTRVCCGGLS
jgi:hypothetical protein